MKLTVNGREIEIREIQETPESLSFIVNDGAAGDREVITHGGVNYMQVQEEIPDSDGRLAWRNMTVANMTPESLAAHFHTLRPGEDRVADTVISGGKFYIRCGEPYYDRAMYRAGRVMIRMAKDSEEVVTGIPALMPPPPGDDRYIRVMSDDRVRKQYTNA